MAKWNPQRAFSFIPAQWPLLITFRCLNVQQVPTIPGLQPNAQTKVPTLQIAFKRSNICLHSSRAAIKQDSSLFCHLCNVLSSLYIWNKEFLEKKNYCAYIGTCWFLGSNSNFLLSSTTHTQMYFSILFTLTPTKTTGIKTSQMVLYLFLNTFWILISAKQALMAEII